MITANLTYSEPTRPPRGRSLEIIRVQVVEIWRDEGRTWARVRALDCAPFHGLRDGKPYESDWTVVDHQRLRDVSLIFAQPGQQTRLARQRRKIEEILLREVLLGGSREHKA